MVDYSFTEPDAAGGEIKTVALSLDAYEEWQGGLAWSRNLNQVFHFGELEISPKLVLGWEYTDISNNPNLQNRLLASLSYVLPFTAGTTMPLTLVYANQSRYRGEVDKELSVHLGLNYKFNRK